MCFSYSNLLLFFILIKMPRLCLDSHIIGNNRERNGTNLQLIRVILRTKAEISNL